MPSLEQLAAQYFPPEVVPKVLWVIQHESGGDPTAVGDGGAAYGLFQSHYIPAGTSVEDQFADAARLYRADLAQGGTGFGDWGEGRLYQGQPFGSLGNNPYPGDTVNGPINNLTNFSARRTPSVSTALGGQVVPDDNSGGGIFSTLGQVGRGLAQTTAKTDTSGGMQTSGPGFTPIPRTGDFAKDSQAYTQAFNDAYAKLHAYLVSKGIVSSKVTQDVIDPTTGQRSASVTRTVYIDPKTGQEDPQATRLAGEADYYSTAIDQMIANKKAGIDLSGNDAAKAYVQSEITKADETRKEYDTYIKQISDLAQIEDLPIERQMKMGQALSAVNKANSERQSNASGLSTFQAPQTTNMAPFASALRQSIPGQAPVPYQVPGSAYGQIQPPSGGLATAVRSPATGSGMQVGPSPQNPGIPLPPPEEINPFVGGQ